MRNQPLTLSPKPYEVDDREGGAMKPRRLMVPVLLSLLALLLASASVLAYSGHFYVIPSAAPLRECPSPSCDVLHTVYQGDKVEILERNATGWSKVRLVDRPTGIGWIRNDLLSYSPDRKTATMPTYHVTIDSLPLREHPRPESRVLTMLSRNDPVEMLGVGTSGWAQVRDFRTSQVGYVPPRYIAPGPGRPR